MKALQNLSPGIVTCAIALLLNGPIAHAQGTKISRDELRDKLYAFWLGQMVGNIYGLPHENQYIDKPGPATFPYGYSGNLERLKETDGAFSDDDTDIEYIYLLQMEKHGPEPTYRQLTDAWLHHIRERVWLANRAALGLMHFGYTPPYTGRKDLNPHWFQIDPQLINEIWGATAPGMVTYAAQKSAWAARITNDDWGIEPTIHYGAMFAAAFFESDVKKLIDAGLAALPPNSRFATTINDVKRLYEEYPDDWQRARQEIAKKYYHEEPLETRTIWNANLNAACGILALLYGDGDFQRTLDLACAMGFDADNQAATMSGLLAVAGGTKVIPRNLLYPIAEWEKPFNDIYRNVSRYDLPDMRITDMTDKTLDQAREIIVRNGGSVVTENGLEYFLINAGASFNPPLEAGSGPLPLLTVDTHVNESLGLPHHAKWRLSRGTLPPGMMFVNGMLRGTPTKTGVYSITLEGKSGNQTTHVDYHLLVRGRNLASQANEVISNVRRTHIPTRDSMWLSVSAELYATDVEVIRDGVRKGKGSVFYSIDGTHHPKRDFYGYTWNDTVTVGLIGFAIGSMEENGGWFTNLNVEFLDADGSWRPVQKLSITPDMPDGDQPYNKPHFVEYLLSFEPVSTKGIRIIGDAGAADHWYSKKSWFTSITELSVYKPVPGIDTIIRQTR